MAVLAAVLCQQACSKKTENRSDAFPTVSEVSHKGWFPLTADGTARIIVDDADFPVVGIAAGMLTDDVERITGKRPEMQPYSGYEGIADIPAVIAGTVGHSRIIDEIGRAHV